MISGFSNPWSPVFMASIIPKYFKKYQKVYGNILVKYYLWKSETQKTRQKLELIHIATQPHSHIATQPYSHIAKQLHSHRATQPHSYIATKESTKGGRPEAALPLWRRSQAASFVSLWLCGYVAMWLYGYVAKFQKIKISISCF